MDVFPHDHPLLDKEPEHSDLAKEMSTTLNDIVKNCKENDKIRGYMFVYDASNKYTFESLSCLIETIKEIEKSDRRGKKAIIYTPKKIVIGNKKDLKKKKQVLEKTDYKKLEGMRFREVSALTNQGIYEAFKILVQDIHSCNILHKELYDLEKQKNKDNEDMNNMEVKNLAFILIQENEGRPEKRGGILNFLPFFNCYGVITTI